MFDDHAGVTGTEPGTGAAGASVGDDADRVWAELVRGRDLAVELGEVLEAASAGLAPATVSTFPDDVDADTLMDVLSTAATRWDPCTATDDELLVVASTVEAARRRLDAVSLHALAELDARGVSDTRVGLITGSWLASEAQLATGACKARVKLAMKLRVSLPDVDTALSEGRISVEHARVLADAANPRIIDEFAMVTNNLIDAASRLGFDQWKRDVTALASLLDTNGGHRPGDDICDNTLRVSRGLDNTLRLDGQFVGEFADIAEHAINERADQIWHRYRNDENLTPDLRVPPRTTLRALATIELFREALAKNTGSTTPARPEVSLIINAADPTTATTTHNIRIGDTEHHTLLCDPVFRAVVMGVHGTVINTGRDARLVNRAQRHALEHRDGGCVFPGCDQPASWTDAHHVDHWINGGPTDTANLASLCRYHHGVSHRTGWTMHTTPDQWFWWQTPSGHTFWSQRHQHQRTTPTPHPDTT